MVPRGVLINITGGRDLGLHEANEATKVISEVADSEANIILGTVVDENLENEVKVTVIATGFDSGEPKVEEPKATVKKEEVEEETLNRDDLDIKPFF